MHHAHSQGIVHRDVKPSNLLVDEHLHLWITDFGLAATQASANLTMTGNLIGTLRYMSPEQALGEVDVPSALMDVYSLGATLYELLSGWPVHEDDDRRQLLRRIADEEPVRLRARDPRIPRDLETIVHKALARAPGRPLSVRGEHGGRSS